MAIFHCYVSSPEGTLVGDFRGFCCYTTWLIGENGSDVLGDTSSPKKVGFSTGLLHLFFPWDTQVLEKTFEYPLVI